MPHGFDLARIGPPQPIQRAQTNVLLCTDGCNDLGIRLSIEGIKAGFGIGVCGECAVPIGGLGGFGAGGGGDVEEGGSDGDSAGGEGFGEVCGSEVEEVLLLEAVGFEDCFSVIC